MTSMRTALINPPDTFGPGYEEQDAIPPLGIAYIASVLRENGFTVDLFDLASELPLSVERLERGGFFDYDVYGFTAYSKCFPAALEVLSVLRRRNRRAFVVFGGPHASPCAEQLLGEYAEIDCVIRNEGEYPMLRLMQHIRDGTPDLSEVPNLVYREGGLDYRREGPQADTARPVRCNATTYVVDDLDTLPHPARDYVIEPDRRSLRYNRRDVPVQEVHICSSRGCPKRCTFCSIVVASPTYRVRSVDSLMAEIKELYAASPFGHVYFVDANFAVSAKRTLAFSRALHNWNPGVTWSGTATADLVIRHADVLEEVARLNCVHLEIGIESGSESQLARYNKRTTVSDNRQAISLLRRCGISLGLDFVMFDPETTLAELRENLDFLFETELFGTSPPACLFNGMRLYPGTPARDRYIRMFGLSDHHLASIYPPLADAKAADFYRLNREYFEAYQAANTDAQVLLQERWRRLDCHGSEPNERQRLAVLIIELQHEPYRFFDELLTAFEAGAVGPGVALQNLTGMEWHGRAVRLLRRALTAIEGREPDEQPGTIPAIRIERVLDGNWGAARRIASDLVFIKQDETIYLLPARGKPVRLNFQASYLWEQIVKGVAPAEVVAEYSIRFGVEPSRAHDEYTAFIREMHDSRHLVSTGFPRVGCEEFDPRSGFDPTSSEPALTSVESYPGGEVFP